MKILAIVVTYKGKQWYDNCFSSLLHSTVPVDIFVVDNASRDGTVDYIREKYPMIHLFESDVNLGFGQANNKGFRYALDNGYDYVFLLNQDAWLYKSDSIELLVNAYEQNSKYAIVAPLLLYGDGKRIIKDTKRHIIDSTRKDNDFFSDSVVTGEQREIYDINYMCAAAWLLPAKILMTIGGFDPIFFHYGEDDNYMQRVYFHGYKIGLVPSALICHDVEWRCDDYGKENNNWKKNLLIELADVNETDKNKIYKYVLLSMMKNLLFFRLKRFQNSCKWFLYIRKNRVRIQESLVRNSKGGCLYI